MVFVLETIKKLVAIPSVTGAAPEPGKPYGPYVYEALETALAFCEGLGFRTKLETRATMATLRSVQAKS